MAIPTMGNGLPHKSCGTTKSERYLAQLCEKSFLKMWSFPNPFRGQTQGPSHREGKELCDLLVVFGNDLILFSDKSCQFPDTGHLGGDWSRWYRRAIHASAKQLSGAERWVRQFPDRIYLDRACLQPIPKILPDVKSIRFHHVVVALGAAERFKKETSRHGSLLIDCRLVGNAHLDPSSVGSTPFCVGSVRNDDTYVHVLDDNSLDQVLRELDTVSDFVEYLAKKELFLQNTKLVGLGEEDLLAYYLENVDYDQRHSFLDHPYPNAKLEIGGWDQYQSSLPYRIRTSENKVSYLWDSIIEEFTGHLFSKTLSEGGNLLLEDVEQALRTIASERRVRRRFLVKALVELEEISPPNLMAFRTVVSFERTDSIYVFLLFPESEVIGLDYRTCRGEMLSAYCLMAASRDRRVKQVIGLGSELHPKQGRSFDLALFSTEVWTPEMEEEVDRSKKLTGLMRPENLNWHPRWEYEYGVPAL